jgi:hypothetical protein
LERKITLAISIYSSSANKPQKKFYRPILSINIDGSNKRDIKNIHLPDFKNLMCCPKYLSLTILALQKVYSYNQV